MKFGEEQKGPTCIFANIEKVFMLLEYPPVRSTRTRLSVTPKEPEMIMKGRLS